MHVRRHIRYFLPTVSKVLFLNQPVGSDLKTNDNIQKIGKGQGDGYATD